MLDELKIQDLIKKHKESGLSLVGFCSNEGIPKSTFYYWRKKFNKEPSKRFIPLVVNSTPVAVTGYSKSGSCGQKDLHIPAEDYFLELIYSNGTRLRVKGDLDIDNLRLLVCLLG
jgi:hypothetical protein